jgi:exosortase
MSSPNPIARSVQVAAFSVLGAIGVFVWWKTLASLFALALRDEQYTHILLILPISAALVVLDWRAPRSASSQSLGIGFALLLLAVLIIVISSAGALPISSDAVLSASVFAFVLWCAGAFVVCFGMEAFQHSLFPICFLLWMVPFPPAMLNAIVSVLQRGSAVAAHLLFLVAGIPVGQRDTLLYLPGVTLEVAPECSSMRSSMMLIVTTMVVGQLLLRSFWRKTALVAAAIPLSIAKNGLRIFVLGAIATRVDPGILDSRLHRQGGIIFFLIALAGIVTLLWLLRRGEEKSYGRD